MNRKNRRRMNKTMTPDEIIQDLQRQLKDRERVIAMQHNVIKEVESRGHISVLPMDDPALSEMGMAIPYSALPSFLEKGIKQGRAEGLEVSAKYYRAEAELQSVLAAIGAAAMADNGKRTQETLNHALENLPSVLNRYDLVVSEIEADKRFNAPDKETVQSIMQHTVRLRKLLKEYKINPTAANHEAIRIASADGSAGFKQLLDRIKIIVDNRGRKPDEAKLAFGSIAKQYPKPKRGRNWQLGVQIYRDLKGRKGSQLTDNEQIVIDELSCYMKPGKTVVSPEQKTDLGIWVSSSIKLAEDKPRLE